MSPLAWAGFVVAAAVGAPARYLVDSLVQERIRDPFPLGTFLVNVSGSFVLSFLTGLALHHHLAATTKTVLGTGFCGAYTTFSTFTFESVRLLEEGDTRQAAVTVAGSLIAGTLAAAAGMVLATV